MMTKRNSPEARWLSAAAAALLIAGCSPAGEQGNTAANVANAMATPTASASPAASPSTTPVAQVEKTDLIDFSYTYPGLSVAKVAGSLARRAGQARAKALAVAREGRQAAAKNGFPYRTHVYHADWSVTADTPRLLSLVATIGTYTGGAHGMTVFEPLLWDKQAGKEIDVAALFTGPKAMDEALRDPFCDSLDRERAKKRGAPVKRDDAPFDECIDPAKEVIVPTAGDGGAIDGFTVYVAPYDAGPYAEGDYQVTVPVDAAVLKAIAPAYRDAFAEG